MSQAFSVHHVAQHLLTWEATRTEEPLELPEVTSRACTRLCHQFGRLVGDAGCDLLMVRALSRAAAEHPMLQGVRWHNGATGCLEGLAEHAADHDPSQVQAACGSIITAFLSILTRFIGEDLTRRQLERAWPELQPGDPATEAGA